MNDPVRSRIVVLAGLAVLGVLASLTGSALGVGGPIAADEPAAEFAVSEDGVTVSGSEGDVTVVEDMDDVDAVEITAVESGIRVETASDEPLSDRERERARRIAAENATVQRLFDEPAPEDLAVEPVEVVDADEVERVEIEATPVDENGSLASESDAAEPATYSVETVEGDADGSVTIDREPSYADGVLVRPDGAGPGNYAVVDLDAGAVTRVATASSGS